LLTHSSIVWYQPIGGDALAGGKVTVGLASHWPRVTDMNGFPPAGSWPERGRRAHAYALLWSMVDFTFYLYTKRL